jgi:hypothetical protein
MWQYGVTAIPNDFILHRMLERAGFLVFVDTDGWCGYHWYAALPEFDIERWLIELPNGDLWLGGEAKPNEIRWKGKT